MDIKDLHTKEDLKDLVVGDWGYTDVGELPIGFDLKKETDEKIIEKKLIAEHAGFHILFFKIDTSKKSTTQTEDGFMRSTEREVIGSLEKSQRKSHLFIFSSPNGEIWHFVYSSSTSQVNTRRFSIFKDNRDKLRTASDQLSRLQVTTGDTIQDIISKQEFAFDIEEVTQKFFRVFSDKFLDLMDQISKFKPGVNKKDIADITQLILNRIVFLKFIEKKGWLDKDKNYLYKKFQNYYDGDGLFWQEILCPLFHLLANQHDYNDAGLGKIPFLNGGLFGNEPRDLSSYSIPNEYFKNLFEDLLNRFNFTIEESSPTSIEVAVDPEMLGRIFEALILTIEKSENFEEDLRRANGAYYTPRIVVFHMCRMAIAKSLSHKTEIDEVKIRSLIDKSVDDIPDEEQLKSGGITKNEAGDLLYEIEKISICDPAVGSGAFLLIALQILTGLRRFLNEFLGNKIEGNYNLKEKIIFNNLVGVDILKQAVHICELRLWLSLVVDHKAENPDEVPPLPNLTYKIFHGDSVVDRIEDKSFDAIEEFRQNFVNYKRLPSDEAIKQNLDRLINLKEAFYHSTNENDKKEKMKAIKQNKIKIFIEILKKDRGKVSMEQGTLIDVPKQYKLDLEQDINKTKVENIDRLIKYFENTLRSDASMVDNDRLNFIWLIDLVEYFVDHGNAGFDIIIGNPPYGVKNETMETGKERYGLESKDSFGIFMAMAVKELLKDDGVLSFITSDTWQTIKSHKALRRIFLDNMMIHELLMMPAWIFGATVNTSIIIATKVDHGAIKGEENEKIIYENSQEIQKNDLVACDFTRATEKSGELEEYLYGLDNFKTQSTEKVAYYKYSQGLIEQNSNTPFFVGSPKIFELMHNVAVRATNQQIAGKDVNVREIVLNKRTLKLVRFGDIADVRQGLATGDNHTYLFQNPEARGSYQSIDNYRQFLLSDSDLERISKNDKLRLSIINKGIFRSELTREFDKKRWFNGKYIVPYDKGGESDVETGWLPNYYVPTQYYINWSTAALSRMKSYTIAERITDRNERKKIQPHYRKQTAAVFRSPETYFTEAISFSQTGQYCPTFRLNSKSVYDVVGSEIFQSIFNTNFVLGVLSSKLYKLLFKTFIDHTVHFQVDEVKEIPFPLEENVHIIELVSQIILKQKKDLRYNYMENEQRDIEIDVYRLFGMNDEDIKEVETWYARKYPKLAKYCDID